MLWLWIGIKQYELDSRGTTPLNSNAKKREAKTSCQFLAAKVPFLKENKAADSSASNYQFFSCNENPCTF